MPTLVPGANLKSKLCICVFLGLWIWGFLGCCNFDYTIQESKNQASKTSKIQKIPKTQNPKFQKSRSCTNLQIQILDIPRIQKSKVWRPASFLLSLRWSGGPMRMTHRFPRRQRNYRILKNIVKGSGHPSRGPKKHLGGRKKPLWGPKGPLGVPRDSSEGSQETPL